MFPGEEMRRDRLYAVGGGLQRGGGVTDQI
jgi:hypothetical protein